MEQHKTAPIPTHQIEEITIDDDSQQEQSSQGPNKVLTPPSSDEFYSCEDDPLSPENNLWDLEQPKRVVHSAVSPSKNRVLSPVLPPAVSEDVGQGAVSIPGPSWPIFGSSRNRHNIVNGTFRCNGKECPTCNILIQADEIVGEMGKYPISGQFTCKSECVIYAIVCAKCNKIYVGETSHKLRDRVRDHLNKFKTVKTELATHFLTKHELRDMRVTAIQNAPKKVNERKELEQIIISKLGSNYPMGLNMDYEVMKVSLRHKSDEYGKKC